MPKHTDENDWATSAWMHAKLSQAGRSTVYPHAAAGLGLVWTDKNHPASLAHMDMSAFRCRCAATPSRIMTSDCRVGRRPAHPPKNGACR
jgi:hypothetical protein